jgi:membrane protease YdiL (CAAX protease family)
VPIQIGVPVAIVGLIFVVAGIAAYAGRWRRWVLRSRRPWVQGTGFASLAFGLAVMSIVAAAVFESTLGDLPLVPGIALIVLAMVMIARMPEALAPRWFRDREL